MFGTATWSGQGTSQGLIYSTCSDAKAAAKNYDFKECSEKASKTYLNMDPGVSNAVASALLPIPVIWFAVWLMIVVLRWVVRGFRSA
jgi:hypothetical protein